MTSEKRTQNEGFITEIVNTVYTSNFEAISDIKELASENGGKAEIDDYCESGTIEINNKTYRFEIFRDSLYTRAVTITEELTDEQYEKMYFGE